MPRDQEKKWSEKNKHLEKLKKQESKPSPIKAGVEIFGETFPDFAQAGVHAASNEGLTPSRAKSIQVQQS